MPVKKWVFFNMKYRNFVGMGNAYYTCIFFITNYQSNFFFSRRCKIINDLFSIAAGTRCKNCQLFRFVMNLVFGMIKHEEYCVKSKNF